MRARIASVVLSCVCAWTPLAACSGDDIVYGDDAGPDATAHDATAHDATLADAAADARDDGAADAPDDGDAALDAGDAALDAKDADRDAAVDAGGAIDATPPIDAALDVADAATDAFDAGCVSDASDGGFPLHVFEWSFAVSDPTLNGGKGQVVTASRCDFVAWHNTDAMDHTVTSAGNFDWILPAGATSPPMQVTAAGTFDYVCDYHLGAMKGELTVTP